MRRRLRFFGTLLLVVLLMHGLPWWALVYAPSWSPAVVVAGSAFALVSAAGLPYLMARGHGPRHRDSFARVGDVWLGVIWQLFAWSVLGGLVSLGLALAGVDDPARSRAVAVAVLGVVLALLVWGHLEVRRLPRIKALDVALPRLGAGLDGLRVVLLADTHFGPFNRTAWSTRLVETVNGLKPDIVCHLGDLADGSVTERREQVDPLADVQATLARVYITGNHEYFGDAQGWLDHMTCVGWTTLHNRALVVQRGTDRLVVAGVDDATAAGSGLSGHGANLQTALDSAEPALPILLLAHQPRQVTAAASAGVDLQVSGHTHGGQMWPFHYLIRVDQPLRAGLRRFGERTQLYVSRGSGYWGPPFRIFAPSEISLLTLRSPPPPPPPG